MTDSRKLTDNELEQVVGGNGTPGVSFSVGNYVKKSGKVSGTVSEIVYKIDTLNGFTATATRYEKKPDGSVTTTTDQSIILGQNWEKLDPQPGWVPAN